jgi:hypothetical protein
VESDLEIIDAFIDGERVDAGALKSALASDEGRSYLVDAWLLREAVREVETSSAIVAMPARLHSQPKHRWLIAAAVAGSLIGGYALGHLTVAPGSVAPAAAPVAVTVGTQPQQAYPVPAATRIIQLEFQTPPNTSGGD